MQLANRPIFKKIISLRFFVGLFSTILNCMALYIILSVTHTPNLDSDWGMIFGWKPWMGEGWWKLVGIMIFIVLSTLGAGESFLKNKNVKQIYPKKDDSKTNNSKNSEEKPFHIQLPKYISEEQIIEKTMSIAKKMNVKVSSIFIGHNPIPNAFTTFAIDYGNIVFINSNLLDILDEKSIEAVIAHEIGHIKGDDVLHKIGNSLPMQVMRSWTILIVFQCIGIMFLSPSLWIFCKRFLLVITTFLCFGMLTRFLNKYVLWFSRIKEKIADAYAVEYTSIEGMMNGLLRLNERSHTLQTFIKALKQEDADINQEVIQIALHNFPTGSKTEEFIVSKASKFYIEAQLELLIKKASVEFTVDEKSQILEMFLQNKTKKETEEKETEEKEKKEESHQTEPPFLWQEFDWNHDGELQCQELAGLIAALKERPKALTDAEDDENNTHPSIRNRILFIAELYAEKFEIK